MNAVMICLGDNPENQDNNIPKFLEVLLSNDAKAWSKKRGAEGLKLAKDVAKSAIVLNL